MSTKSKRRVRTGYAQTLSPASTSECIPHAPKFNALRHGLNSGYVLLPGDDVAAFRKQRRRLFEHYQPRTVEEAQCVERIAAGQWRMYRSELEHAGFKRHLGAVMDGHPDVLGRACDPDPHRLHHRGSDCAKEETRWERTVRMARAELGLMQKQRVQNFTVRDTTPLEDYRVFLEEGEPVVDWEQQAASATQAAPQTASEDGPRPLATGSTDMRTGKYRERATPLAAQRFPRHWSRRQQEAALRRVAKAPG